MIVKDPCRLFRLVSPKDSRDLKKNDNLQKQFVKL